MTEIYEGRHVLRNKSLNVSLNGYGLIEVESAKSQYACNSQHDNIVFDCQGCCFLEGSAYQAVAFTLSTRFFRFFRS